MRLPRFLGPTKPGALHRDDRHPQLGCDSFLQVASMSSPISPVTHVAYTKTAAGCSRGHDLADRGLEPLLAAVDDVELGRCRS